MAIVVERDRIITGAILGFEVDGRQVGATTGEATVRRTVEFYDVVVEQASGTIKKSITNDARFVEISLAEASLENLHRAWGDLGGVERTVSEDGVDFGVDESNPYGLANDGLNLFMTGSDQYKIYNIDDLGQAFRAVKASNAAAAPTNYGISVADDVPSAVRGMTILGEDGYFTALDSATTPVSYLYKYDIKTGVAAKIGSTGLTDTGVTLTNDGTKVYVVTEDGTNYEISEVTLATGLITATQTLTEDIVGLGHDGTNMYGVTAGVGAALYAVDPSDGAVTRIGDSTDFGVGVTEVKDITFFGGDIWMTASLDSKGRIYRVDRQTGVADAVGDIDTMNLNNPANAELERSVKLITPGSNDRFRAYKFFRCVSLSEGEHMFQKAGQTMIPIQFEVLNDPRKRDGAQFGVVSDFPTIEAAEAF